MFLCLYIPFLMRKKFQFFLEKKFFFENKISQKVVVALLPL